MIRLRKSAVPVLTEILPLSGEAPAQAGDGAEAHSGPVSGPLPSFSKGPDASSTVRGPDLPGAQDKPSQASPPVVQGPTEGELIERILVDVQRQMDLMIEHRLSQALDQALEGLHQRFASETRQAVHAALTDVVTTSVQQELARTRQMKRSKAALQWPGDGPADTVIPDPSRRV